MQSLERESHAPSKRKREQKEPVHQLGVSELDPAVCGVKRKRNSLERR